MAGDIAISDVVIGVEMPSAKVYEVSRYDESFPYNNIREGAIDNSTPTYDNYRKGEEPSWYVESKEGKIILEELPCMSAGDYVGADIYRANYMAMVDAIIGEIKRNQNVEEERIVVPGLHIVESNYGYKTILYSEKHASKEIKDLVNEYKEKVKGYPIYNEHYSERITIEMMEDAIGGLGHEEQQWLMKEAKKNKNQGIVEALDKHQIRHHPESCGLIYYIDEKAIDAILEKRRRLNGAMER